jgi:hypothetical protein
MRTNRNEHDMSTAARLLLEETRRKANELVERAERQTGSKMSAYEQVASMVGVSSSWLRHLIGRQPDIDLKSALKVFNIAAAYDRVCARVETAAAHEQELAAEFRRQVDAADQSNAGMVAPLARPEALATDGGGAQEAPPVLNDSARENG